MLLSDDMFLLEQSLSVSNNISCPHKSLHMACIFVCIFTVGHQQLIIIFVK
jgi:hypothetical protein